MKKEHVLPIVMLLTASIFTACKDEEVPELTNDEELITTLTLTFEDDLTGALSTFTFRDADGPGGAAPTTFDTIRLTTGSTYQLHISLLNESVSPAEDLTTEVEDEGDAHQLFYTVADADITFAYADTDTNGDPVGLHMTASAGSAGSGTVTVTLKHQPGTKDGNITTGETDVEITFVAEIE